MEGWKELRQGRCQRESRKENDGQEKGNGGEGSWRSCTGQLYGESLDLEMQQVPGKDRSPNVLPIAKLSSSLPGA